MELSRTMQDIWKDITGYEGIYQVSDTGKVRSLKLGRELTATPDNRGLCRVSLRKDGRVDRPYIHQLVMQEFGERKEGSKLIAHKDGNAANNDISNLYWVECEWNKKPELSDDDMRKINEMYSEGCSLSNIARATKKDVTAVYCATKGFASIPDEFEQVFSSFESEVEFAGDKFRLSEMLQGNAYVSSTGTVIKICSKVKRLPKVLKTSVDRNGYETLNYATGGDSRKYHGVHRLVADAFLPRVEGKDYVNHKDGCKTNNSVENLEWCTKSENTRHAFATGLKKPARGEKHGMVKLTEAQVAEIRAALDSGETGVAIAKRFGISTTNVSSIKRNTIWSKTV